MAAIQFSSSQYDKKHIKGLSKRERSLSVLFSEFCKEVAVIGATTGFRDAKKEFYLSSYPAAQRAIKRLLAQLASDITNVVRTGNKAAWEISEDKNTELLQQVGRNITLPKHMQERVKQSSVNALAAFEERKVNGMNLSKRVWNLVQPLQGQMELALELGLSEGKGAASLSRDVRQYLLNPDKLFRRVRGKDGILRLSKAAAAYHPGQGVYRSSYKNALRMTVTENNMAYRSADYAQWEEMPFVIGTEIGLSNNHPVVDICDELSGVYPKDFKFVGWHPFCRCFATPKLADRSEVNKWARMTDEERKGYRFKGTVDALPKQFNTWVKNNTERIAKAKKLPYFLKDNKEIIERAAKPAVVHHEVLTKATNDLPYIHNFNEDRKSIFTTKKKYANGGKVMMMKDVDKTKSDYNSILTIANYFARQGKIVKIPSQIHFKSDDYKRVFGKLIGTKYERKCPDIIVGENFIEFEGFIKPWTKKKVGRMLSHGLQQSNCIIIDNNKGCNDRFIRKAIMARLHLPNQDIKEVWIYEKGKPRLFFKDGLFYKRQQEG